MGLFVQYGCGSSCPDGWLNFDASPSLRLQRLPAVGGLFKRGPMIFDDAVRHGDIVRGLPITARSADGVYASHILEHLAYEDFWRALENTYRMLKPGGVFRLVVPDLEGRARSYLAALDSGDPCANDRFMRATYLGRECRPRQLAARLRAVLGNSAHLWMWDEKSMSAALEKVGFVSVRRCRFGDATEPEFTKVENAGRFFADDDDFRGHECAIEARRPLES